MFRKKTSSTELMCLPNTRVHAPETEKQNAANNILSKPKEKEERLFFTFNKDIINETRSYG